MKKNIKTILVVLNLILILSIAYFGKGIFEHYFYNETMVVVPNVTDLDTEQASKILEKAGLDFNIIESRSSEVPIGIIYNQMPEANKKVKINRAIKLYVNSEEGDTIPLIKGLSVSEATALLKDKNIEISRIDYYQDNTKLEDTIISSFPKEGARIKYGEKISLLVASRNLTASDIMPNIIGLNIIEGQRILKDLEYKRINIVGTENSTVPENTIISTEPLPNVKTDKDSIITIHMSISKAETELDKIIIEKKNIQKDIEDILKQAEKEKNNDN